MIFFLVVLCIGIPTGLLGQYSVKQECECGTEVMSSMRKSSRRIIHGKGVLPHSFPWMVYLTEGPNFFCGGTIINDLYVLTAGHCVHDQDWSKLKVVVGAHTLNTDGVVVGIENIIPHPVYYEISGEPYNDIALIKLQGPLQFSDEIKPICLPREYRSYANQKALVAGWGQTEHVRSSNQLLYTKLYITSDEICQEAGGTIPQNICAYQFNTSTCMGDSGGALFIETVANTFEIVGIVSFGSGDCDSVSAYTQITSYITWIYDNTRDAFYCTNPVETLC